MCYIRTVYVKWKRSSSNSQMAQRWKTSRVEHVTPSGRWTTTMRSMNNLSETREAIKKWTPNQIKELATGAVIYHLFRHHCWCCSFGKKTFIYNNISLQHIADWVGLECKLVSSSDVFLFHSKSSIRFWKDLHARWIITTRYRVPSNKVNGFPWFGYKVLNI